jgi:CheY-like chemotaxis protein
MSHEIRTPMNAVLGMLTLLRRTELTPRQADYAAETDGAAHALLGLLDEILDFSKIEAGKMTPEPRPVRMDRLLRDLSVVLSANLGTKHVDVLFDIDPALPTWLVGDAMRLQQVLVNLGCNAIRFTAGGEVVLSLAVVGRDAAGVTLEISVRETGIGIAPENHARIFGGFTRAEASTTRRYGGTGLGLAISRRLVAMMVGELALESAVGEGSRFHFRLAFPLAAEGLDDGDLAAAPAVPLHALIVDDNPQARAVLEGLGRSLGWTLAVADSGARALDLLQERAAAGTPCEAIFVDAQMPGMDGWRTCARIRELGAHGSAPIILMMDLQMPTMDGCTATPTIRLELGMRVLPIVAMTANAMPSDRDACLAAGMNDHVAKPFDLDHLVRVLRRHAGRLALPDTGPPAAAPLPGSLGDAAAAAGVDVDAALSRLGGERAIYGRMLTTFVSDLAAMPVQLQAAHGGAPQALRLLHTLGGLAASLGVTASAQRPPAATTPSRARRPGWPSRGGHGRRRPGSVRRCARAARPVRSVRWL